MYQRVLRDESSHSEDQESVTDCCCTDGLFMNIVNKTDTYFTMRQAASHPGILSYVLFSLCVVPQ
jgi:hypothetical protein